MNSSETYTPAKLRRTCRHNIRGVDYCVNEWGDDEFPTLFYLHGWGDTGSMFQFVVDAFARDWHVVAPDWRGFGRSSHAGRGYWFPDYLADLDTILDVYSGENPARIIGHSMGANIGGLYAGVMPERVQSFVNIEGFGLADGDPANAPANYRRWIERNKSSMDYATYASFEELVPRIRKRSAAMTPDKAMYVAKEWATKHADSIVRIRADPLHKLPNAVQYRRAEAMACWDSAEAKVLLVLGAETDFTSALQSWIDPDESHHPFRGAPTVSIPGAGHMVHFDAPEALAAVIEDFFGEPGL